MNKAGYTPVMLAALTAAESPDDLEVAQQLLKQGDVNARSRQVRLKRAQQSPTLVTANPFLRVSQAQGEQEAAAASSS